MKTYDAYLMKSAKLLAFDTDSEPDGIGQGDVISSGVQADAYYVDNSHPIRSVGDKLFTSFGFNDSLLTRSAIYDAGEDGYIALEANGSIAIERTAENFAGPASFSLINEDGSTIEALRSLGTKNGSGINGAHVYANASTRIALNEFIGGTTRIGSADRIEEGSVGNDVLSGTAGHDYFLYDTSLGLDLGRDVLANVSIGDAIVTTSALWDGNGDGVINFGANRMLDLPGSLGGARTDESRHPGGQIVFEGNITSLLYTGIATIGGHTYYFYDVASGE